LSVEAIHHERVKAKACHFENSL